MPTVLGRGQEWSRDVQGESRVSIRSLYPAYIVPISSLYAWLFVTVIPVYRGVPLTGYSDRPRGFDGSIHPHRAHGLYTWFTVFIPKDLSGLLDKPMGI